MQNTNITSTMSDKSMATSYENLPDSSGQMAANTSIFAFEKKNENQRKRKYCDSFDMLHFWQPEKKLKQQEVQGCRRKLFADSPEEIGYFHDI